MYLKNLQLFKVCSVFIALFLAVVQAQPPASGANKFLGNITTMGQVRSDFLTYWNQITGENESKWSSIEGRRDQMNWGGSDKIANFANENGITWKFHTLIWGSQYPSSWLDGLSQSEQLEEITEWYDAVAKKYPDVPMIDVVNEACPGHAPATKYKNALGGDGSTGFDWIITAFKMARERWPKAILIYNDYNNCEYDREVDWTIQLIKAMLKANAPVDAIGCQAHDAYKVSTSTVKRNIDKLAECGLPIFITEYDIGESNDSRQEQIMKEQFTMFWNHPKIVGITYWGYIVGNTWRNGTGLKTSSGTERPALTWLMKYVKDNPNPPNDFPDLLNGGGSGSSNYKLSISTKGRGTVTANPQETSYPEDSVVTLTAKATEGWTFSGWSGDTSGTENPLSISMKKSLKIIANFTTEDGKQDLITNGDFLSGSDYWTFNSWGGDGSGSVIDGEYKLVINTVGDNYYDLQVVQPDILLEKGKTYRLVYDAYASGNRTLDVNIGMPESPYTSFLTKVNGEIDANLTTTKQTFSFEFTMEEPTYDKSRVEFSVGTDKPTVSIDNVSLFEVKSGVACIPVQNRMNKQICIRQNGNMVNITFNNTGKNSSVVKLYDLMGNVVRSARLNPSGYLQNCSFNISGIANGFYMVKVFDGVAVKQTGIVLSAN